MHRRGQGGSKTADTKFMSRVDVLYATLFDQGYSVDRETGVLRRPGSRLCGDLLRLRESLGANPPCSIDGDSRILCFRWKGRIIEIDSNGQRSYSFFFFSFFFVFLNMRLQIHTLGMIPNSAPTNPHMYCTVLQCTVLATPSRRLRDTLLLQSSLICLVVLILHRLLRSLRSNLLPLHLRNTQSNYSVVLQLTG